MPGFEQGKLRRQDLGQIWTWNKQRSPLTHCACTALSMKSHSDNLTLQLLRHGMGFWHITRLVFYEHD
jgi:hypothetical protein